MLILNVDTSGEMLPVLLVKETVEVELPPVEPVAQEELAKLEPQPNEPVPVSEVFVRIANDLNIKMKSPESGGQGGKSSQSNQSGNVTGIKTAEDYNNYRESKGIIANSSEDVELMREVQKANPDLIF